MRSILPLALLLALPAVGVFLLADFVGPVPGGVLVPTGHLVRPAGSVVSFAGRPVDVALSPDGKFLYVKDNRGVQVVAVATMSVVQEALFPTKLGGGSMHGILVSPDGKKLFASTALNTVHEGEIDPTGKVKWSRAFAVPGPAGKGAAHPTGLALTRDGQALYACLSRNNSLARIDLAAGKLDRVIPVGVAPYAVALALDGKSALVTNWGGRRAGAGDKTADSSGTPVVVDDRGIGKSGTVGRVDLVAGKMTEQIETGGLHPAGLVFSGDGKRAFVANANSDSVSVIDLTGKLAVTETVVVRPDPNLPFGSATNALALSRDGSRLFAACGGNNAVAVLDVPAKGPPTLAGFIPAGWYPGAVACDDKSLFVANVKGEGSRYLPPKATGYGVYGYKGTVNRVTFPTAKELEGYTVQVKKDVRVPEVLAALERSAKKAKPVPVPRRLGDPSVIEHVIYVIKENRTYDQVFGDLKQGKGEPKLCIYGRDVTPNHHALAERYVLLDNFYCNGVLSADGHSWATEGNVTDHLEKAFGGFTRSYTYGDDALTYSSSGFLWDNALLAGRTFRNYGELWDTKLTPAKTSFTEMYRQHTTGKGAITLKHTCGISTLHRFSCPDYPGWNMTISDQQRMDVFLREFREFEKKKSFPNLTIVYLPQDHCSGTTPGMPTPAAHMGDNDLALGRLVEAVSKSPFWPKTAIFVVEDDPQNGFDHIDGHRSICLVVSPWAKRKAVVSDFYNQTSVLHTMERILGLPPMNQLDGMSPIMYGCFTETPDNAPYKALAVKTPLDALNPEAKKLKGKEAELARISAAQDVSKPDAIDDDAMNRVLWHAAKGVNVPYPADLAGAHGKGLAGRGLKLEAGVKSR